MNLYLSTNILLGPINSNKQYGHGQRNQHPVGAYKAMNESLIAAIMGLVEEPLEDDNKVPPLMLKMCGSMLKLDQ